MFRIKRMSPALIVAILALVAALVVPAVAQVATKSLTKREVVVVRKVSAFQANRLINRRVPRISRFQANRQISRRVACPAGTVAAFGLCWDAVAGPSSEWVDAFEACAERGAALPTTGQLAAAASRLGVAPNDYLWTDDVHVSGTEGIRAVSVDGDTPPKLSFFFISEEQRYRCVRPRLR